MLFGWLQYPEFLNETITSPKIIVGKHTYCAGYFHGKSFEEQCVRYADPHENSGNLVIGRYCQIATGVVFNIGGNTRHRHDWISTYPFHDFYPDVDLKDPYVNLGDTVLGNDVWIGMEALIMSGIKIGDGAVIGARSIVTKDVPPYTVVTGAPAQPIKKRFSDNEIQMLLELKWWDLDVDELKPYLWLLAENNIEQFVRELNIAKEKNTILK